MAELDTEAKHAIDQYLRTRTVGLVTIALLIGGLFGYLLKANDQLSRDAAVARELSAAKARISDVVNPAEVKIEVLGVLEGEIRKALDEASRAAADSRTKLDQTQRKMDESDEQLKEIRKLVGGEKKEIAELVVDQLVDEKGDLLSNVQQALGNVVTAPLGTIAPFYGSESDLPSDGSWIVCDGRDLTKRPGFTTGEFKTLNAHLQRTNSRLPDWHLPDLRGMFLRGAGQRDKPPIAPAPATVGDLQDDEFRRHDHSVPVDITKARRVATNATGTEVPILEAGGRTGNTGGQETRPMNVGVNWIIKAK